MPEIPPYIGKLIRSDGRVIGTGFVVNDQVPLVATCYHVVRQLATNPQGKSVVFQLLANEHTIEAIVTDRIDQEYDIAILELTERPRSIQAAKLVHRNALRPGMKFHTTGYGEIEEAEGLLDHTSALGEIVGTIKTKHAKIEFLQLRSPEILRGLSGGPVIVDELGVVGIISFRYSIDPHSGTWMRDTAAAVFIERLRVLDNRVIVESLTGHTQWKVFLSRTLDELPSHRKEVINACSRMGMFPVTTEQYTASAENGALAVNKAVDEADIYLGVFAHRYGSLIEDQEISIAELEYNEVVKKSLPRIICVIHEDHPVKDSDIEKGDGWIKLESFKVRIQSKESVLFFQSPEDLRSQVIEALTPYRQPNPASLHYLSTIPQLPEPYIAHPYTLLQTSQLLGRKKELQLLDDWITNYQAPPLYFVVAMGGMGKSAFTWKWFNAQSSQPSDCTGFMWWSFYESDTSFENFVIRFIAYATQRSHEDVAKIPAPEREEQALAIFRQNKFLVVLDGFERILEAYTREHTNRDESFSVQEVDTQIDDPFGIFQGQGNFKRKTLREIGDIRFGLFLKKLSQIHKSRILITTRLFPSNLETDMGTPMPGCQIYFLGGLEDEDALSLWRAFGVSGSDEVILSLFKQFENYPLLIRALAGVVANDRRFPGDFDSWRRANPSFMPSSLPIIQVKSHVLSFAFLNITVQARELLFTIAAFRMPVRYDALSAILVLQKKSFQSDQELDDALTNLEDRGLLGWDRRANRYDLHPVVRGIVWDGMDGKKRQMVYEDMASHFSSIPPPNPYEVTSIDDLAPSVELYHCLIELGYYDDAFELFYNRLQHPTVFRISPRYRVEFLELLLSNTDSLPQLTNPQGREYALNALGQGYTYSGRPGLGAAIYQKTLTLAGKRGAEKSYGIFVNLTEALCPSGQLQAAEDSARKALEASHRLGDIIGKGISLTLLGFALAAREKPIWALTKEESQEGMGALKALRNALEIFIKEAHPSKPERVTFAYLAQRAIWIEDFQSSQRFADQAWDLANVHRFERDIIRTSKLQGLAALGVGDHDVAYERLSFALQRAREAQEVDDELSALIGLGELAHRNGTLDLTRKLLDDVWELAEMGPYILAQVDALNLLAQVEKEMCNYAAAILAARRAYKASWCDGPPYCYYRGLERARLLLDELGSSEEEC